MKQSILTPSPSAFRYAFRRSIVLCAVLAGAAIGLNILFLCLRTDKNHYLMLVLNILTDIACGCFLVDHIHRIILPKWKLLQLTRRRQETIQGTVLHISQEITRYMDIDCLTVTVDSRRLFLPAHTMTLQEQACYRFSVASNILVEAEV